MGAVGRAANPSTLLSRVDALRPIARPGARHLAARLSGRRAGPRRPAPGRGRRVPRGAAAPPRARADGRSRLAARPATRRPVRGPHALVVGSVCSRRDQCAGQWAPRRGAQHRRPRPRGLRDDGPVALPPPRLDHVVASRPVRGSIQRRAETVRRGRCALPVRPRPSGAAGCRRLGAGRGRAVPHPRSPRRVGAARAVRARARAAAAGVGDGGDGAAGDQPPVRLRRPRRLFGVADADFPRGWGVDAAVGAARVLATARGCRRRPARHGGVRAARLHALRGRARPRRAVDRDARGEPRARLVVADRRARRAPCRPRSRRGDRARRGLPTKPGLLRVPARCRG